MSVIVITPPPCVVTADEARAAGVFASDDADTYIETMLEIAQSEIDGPDGWLGRSIGEQVLQVTVPAFPDVRIDCLPYRPVSSIISNTLSADGCTRVVQYNAGQPIGNVPKRIKHAIILMAGVLRDAAPDEGGALKGETVEGIGSKQYSLPDDAAEAMKNAAERLLSTYRVYA
jgi:hypothetical protein